MNQFACMDCGREFHKDNDDDFECPHCGGVGEHIWDEFGQGYYNPDLPDYNEELNINNLSYTPDYE